jgi:hypothetical protein
MSNVTNVVMQMRQERDAARKRVERSDQAWRMSIFACQRF